MPTFCRHNRLLQNCAICSREQAIEPRPLISSSKPRTSEPRPHPSRPARTRGGAGARGSVRVSRLARGADDGYSSPLVPGLRSSEDARRLADELAFAATRLEILAQDPPGLYAEIAAPDGDREERSWLAFLVAYLGPLDAPEPFTEIERIRTTWSSGEIPNLEDAQGGPRTAHDPARGTRAVEAYAGWARRAGSQTAAFAGDAAWTPERRFERAFERLALPGLHRGARFDLLATLGWLRVYELRPAKLQLGGGDEVTLAAKRALGIGDPLLLERRASELASACAIPLAALDLGFYNWERAERTGAGVDPQLSPDAEVLERVSDALAVC